MSLPPRIAPSLRADRIPLEQVPVIDFAPFRTGDQTERKRAALDLAGAFRNVGFAYLAGHGVSQDLIQGLGKVDICPFRTLPTSASALGDGRPIAAPQRPPPTPIRTFLHLPGPCPGRRFDRGLPSG